MPVLSILACEMLEDELVHVLSKDHGIKQLYLVENTNSFRLTRKLKSKELHPLVFHFDRLPDIVTENERNIFLDLILRFSKFDFLKNIHAELKAKKDEQLIIVVNLLSKNLHADLDRLHSEVCRNAREMSKISDGILIFYGKCAYSSESEADLKSLECPVYFLKDNNKGVADDCISVALGGNSSYTETKVKWGGKGSIYTTPMWSFSFQEWLDGSTPEFNDIKKYFDNPEYEQVFKINTPSLTNSDYDRSVSDFAKYFDMNVIEVKGTMELSFDSYMNAKAGVCKR
ncbi:DUF1638 domain-containing protein [Methanolobus sp. ZRKC5]|uniref:DUF1638 domain-containing protein n=1 Tax=unclassified Methanolobus TaxID=2629569 RepID=UPI00313E1D63